LFLTPPPRLPCSSLFPYTTLFRSPGLRVLTDFRWLERMDPAAAVPLAEIMDALAEKDVAAVVRVVPDPHKDIGLNILSQFHYGPQIKLVTFESLAEALSALMDKEIQ